MFIYALVLILLLPIVFLATTLEILFSPDELAEMGICLENPHA